VIEDLQDMLRGPQRPTAAQRRHRRRRAKALASVAAASSLIGLITGASGGGGGTPAASAAATRVGWYGHLQALAGAGQNSLDFERRAAETSAIDRTLAISPIIYTAGKQHREIALTFDDGPGPYTDRVLDVLQQHHVPGTFFAVGTEETYFHAGTSRMVDLGMPIGDHTESHANLTQLGAADQKKEIVEEAARIGAYGAPFPRLFRPPYGAFNDTTMSILKEQKMLAVYWTIDSEDWTRPGIDAIVQNVVTKAQPGAIVLMHDAGGDRSETVAALPTIITRLKAQGYALVTVPRLLLDNPVTANQTPPSRLTQGGAG
jgi:peptidoglycan/xylan/chitin deacetylase (PgdA/CDA1 family)